MVNRVYLPISIQIVTVALRESGKEQLTYKVFAFECLGHILELYELDRFKAVTEITKSFVDMVIMQSVLRH